MALQTPPVQDPATGLWWSADHHFWWDGYAWRPYAPVPPPVSPFKAFDDSIAASRTGGGRWGMASAIAVGWAVALVAISMLLNKTQFNFGFWIDLAITILLEASIGIAVIVAMKLMKIPGPWYCTLSVGLPKWSDLWRVPSAVIANFVVRFGVLIVIVLAIPGITHQLQSNNPLAGVHTFKAIMVMMILGVLLAPICEELLFRGLLLRAITRKYGFVVGTIGSSVLFGLGHAPEEPTVLAGLALASVMFSFGVMQCLLVRWTNRLTPGIGVHMTLNAIGILLTMA